MRIGENALFHLPKEGIVVRIARAMDYWADATKEVNVARWLAEHHVLAAEPHDTPQPINSLDHPVTFWKYIKGRSGDERRDIAVLGQTLRRIHVTPPPNKFTLPHSDILKRVAPRIRAANIPSTDRDFLYERLSDLESRLPELRFPLEPTVTHGDPHVENLMMTESGPVLIDFEGFAWGQPEWDLAVIATEYRTAKWLNAEDYNRFVNAYGYDIMSWTEGFELLRAVHELKMCTWLMQNVDESSEIAAEYQLRMRTLRREPSTGWHPF
jgi:thiamine kinase-like enzyme